MYSWHGVLPVKMRLLFYTTWQIYHFLKPKWLNHAIFRGGGTASENIQYTSSKNSFF
jgi:hypothetical protein